jgi:hypothetical protein
MKNKIRTIFAGFFISIVVIISFGSEAHAAWLSGWSYRKQITIDQTRVDSDLINFPVYIFLDPARSGSGLASKIRDDGYDIRFTSSDGTTVLSYERESYFETSGHSMGHFWVKVPVVSGIADTVI